MRGEPKYLPVPPGHLIVTIEVAAIIDEMFARGLDRCTAAELEAVIYHAVLLNEHYRPQFLREELEPV